MTEYTKRELPVEVWAAIENKSPGEIINVWKALEAADRMAGWAAALRLFCLSCESLTDREKTNFIEGIDEYKALREKTR